MINSSNSSHIEWFSINRTPFFFSRTNIYSYWKTRMSEFLKSIIDYDLWDDIQNGTPHVPTKIENGVVVPKPSQK